MKSKKKRKLEDRADESKVKQSIWENIAVAFCLLMLLLLWITAFFRKKIVGNQPLGILPLMAENLGDRTSIFDFYPSGKQKATGFFKAICRQKLWLSCGKTKIPWVSVDTGSLSFNILHL